MENQIHRKNIPYASYLPQDKLVVVVSFDGGKELDVWRQILTFTARYHVNCTFFVSGVYFLSDTERDRYEGDTRIGLGGSPGEVEKRKKMVLEAIRCGHDVESHLNGHENGAKWLEPIWQREFEQYAIFCSFLPSAVRHVRFPYLAANPQVYPVLASFQIRSITSTMNGDPGQFARVTVIQKKSDPFTLLEFPMDRIFDQNGKKYLLTDYAFYIRDSNDGCTGRAAKERMVQCYLAQAERCFREHRPLFLSHHFQMWNEGVYWQALEETIVDLKRTYPAQFITVDELYKAITLPIVG